jgi:hypothetical protein
MNEGTSRVREKLAVVQKQMVLKLDEIRATFKQSGDKGTTVEDEVRELLRTYLPSRTRVGHGEIIDTAGRASHQTDIVIVGDDHPYTFTEDLPGLFFIEGVEAAGEIKTVLTSEELTRSLEACKAFKELRPMHSKGAMVRSNPSDLHRFYDRRPWFLFAFESQLSLETIHERIVEFQKAETAGEMEFGDAVFVLGRGNVINFGDGQGALTFRSPPEQSAPSVPGWVRVDSTQVLIDFFGWLSAVMPRILRFDPILTQYLALGS